MQEFNFTNQDFKNITRIVFEKTGINLGESKRNMVYSRLAKRLRELGLNSFSEYCEIVEGNRIEGEVTKFVNAVTTNLTSFFRESHHFEYLAKTAKPLLQKHGELRIWSAGCSQGMEAYSIAMTLAENIDISRVKILATDIDTNVLEKGRNAIYPAQEVEKVPAVLQEKYFTQVADEKFQIAEKLMRLVHFKQLNLLGNWPMRKNFHIIFCRNTVMYFDKPTQASLFKRFDKQLISHGFLIIGHSEGLHGTENFKLIGKTIYQKIV